jgi:hypothetical protein
MRDDHLARAYALSDVMHSRRPQAVLPVMGDSATLAFALAVL